MTSFFEIFDTHNLDPLFPEDWIAAARIWMGVDDMAFLGGSFDASAIEPRQSGDTLDLGKYRMHIVASEMKHTKDGSGQYLQLEMDVLEGPAKGRKWWERLNLVNGNQMAVEIAQRTLSAICHATGKMQINDSEQLHFIPFSAEIKVRKNKKTSEEERYAVYEFARPAPPAPRPQPQVQAPTQPAAPVYTPPTAQQQAPQQAYTPPQAAPVQQAAPPPPPAAAAGATPPWRR